MMPLEIRLQHHIDRMLVAVNGTSARGGRLGDDARRLWTRVDRLLTMNLLPQDADRPAMELACYALQLPLRSNNKAQPAGRSVPMSLRERAEQSAELLIGGTDPADEAIVDRTAGLLRELPQRSPALGESRLLADALNLDDFGMTGLTLYCMHLARLGGGVNQVAEAFEKRQQYGYWEARLKDGFHFEPVRQMARQRLTHVQQAAGLLLQELREDQAL